MKNINNPFRRAIRLLFCLTIALCVNSCESAFEYDLPESNSIPDEILPSANFTYASTLEDFRTIKFTDLSTESTTYFWDFGGGSTSTEQDPTFTFPGEGTYPVSLTASDGRGESDMITMDVEVKEGPFQPIIVEPGFEDNTLPDGSGDGRDSWRKSELGGVIQITGSPVTFGDQGAKMPADQTRIGYQEFAVQPMTNYDLRFWYTMKDDSSDPWLVVSMVGVTQNGGEILTTQEALDNTIASVTVNDTSDPEEYLEQKISFSSGDNDIVAIYFYNGPVEARLDEFSIEVGADGAVPPSAGFDIEQSPGNFLEYTFTNTSTDAVDFMWEFGDGNTSTEESPSHIYADPDVYTVRLEVRNAAGLSASLEKTIDIQAPVTADFTYEADGADYKTINFMDASVGAVELLWEFGDEFQFIGMNPSYTYEEDGIYTVTLTATSLTGLKDSKSMDITIAQGFIASINEAGFEDDDPSGAGCGGGNLDGRDCWRQSDLGGVIQITSSPVNSGAQAAKLPTDGSRIGYQLVQVEANTEYTVSFWYTMKTDPVGSLTVYILDGTVLTDPSQVDAATITSLTVNDQNDANTYIQENIVFNSGANTEIAIFFTNVDVECRLDDFSITKN